MNKYDEADTVCGNCGALLSQGTYKCPYCGSENVENIKDVKISFKNSENYCTEAKLSRAYIYGRRKAGINTSKEEEEFNASQRMRHNKNWFGNDSSENNKVFAILSIIFGCLSVLSIIFNGFSFMLAIAGGILGIISLMKNEKGGEVMAIIGIALSGFAVVGCILRWISYLFIWIF